ncbi:MAG: Ig-like domain-containing protein [Aureispira sp.]
MKFNLIFSLFLLALIGFTACDKTDDGVTTNKILVIENGAINAAPDANITYTAAIIDVEGNRTVASNVTWSSSDNNIVAIGSNGLASITTTGNATITASVEVDGVTLTTTAPLQIQAPALFAVAPSAILVDVDFPDMQLNTVYLGTQSTSYTYSSSNTSVATVSSTGNVNFVGAGNCQITVTASGLNSSFIVPVTVLGAIQIELPVVRVVVSPESSDLLKNETATFTAKAYDVDNNEVSKSIQWSIEDNAIATIDANGVVTAKTVGETKIKAMVSGVVGVADVAVYPNSAIILDPWYAAIPAGSSRTFTAMKHPVVRVNGELALGTGTPTTNVDWMIPTYGGLAIFDIATVDANGTVTMKSNAQIGLATVLIATDKTDPEVGGSSSISVAVGSGGGTGCSCGSQAAGAASINLTSPSTVSLSLGQTAQIQATVVDALGNPVSGAALVYCSDNVQVADVDFQGSISATGFGANTANITVCHGNLSQTIVVNTQ